MKYLLLLLVFFLTSFSVLSAIFIFRLFSYDVFGTVLFLSSICCLLSRTGSVYFTVLLLKIFIF